MIIKPHQGKQFIRLLTIILMLLINNRLPAQNGLKYYMAEALRNNPALMESMNNIHSRNLDRSLTNAQFSLPQISLTANYLFAPYFNNRQLVTTSPDSLAIGYDPSITNGGLYSAQINISKNIFNSGVINAYDTQTGLQIRNSENSIETAKHTLERDITDQYLLTFQAQELYKLSKALVDTLSLQLNLTQQLMLKGLSRQTDYLLLKVELASQQISSEQALSVYKTGLYELNSACGIFDTASVNLVPVELTRSAEVNESNFLRQYSLDSLLVITQQNLMETKYLPQFSIFANAGLNAVELNGIGRKFGMSAGINFTLPVFDGNQKSITRQQSEISSRTIGVQKENQRITIRNKKIETASQIDVYLRNMKAISQQLKDYEQILRISRSELINGQLTMIEFITILRNYLDLKKTEIQTNAGYQQMINQFNYWNW